MKRILSTLMVLVLALVMTGTLMANGTQEDGGKVTLNFPTFWVGQDSKAEPIAALIETFNAQYEGEIEVVIEPNPDTDGYRDKVNTQMSAGQAPDLFCFSPDPTMYSYYDSDILMDFTDDLTGAWAENFGPAYIEAVTKNGRAKTVPYELSLIPVWYNSELFAEAGVSEFPKTMDDFWSAADKLKAAGVVPTSQMTGGSNAWTSMLWFSHMVGSLGGPNAWDRPLSDPIFVQAAEVMQRLYSDGNTTRDAVGGDAGVSGGHYMAGDTAVFLNGPWYIGRIKGDAPETYEATRLTAAPQLGDYYGHQIGSLLTNLAAGNTDDPARRDAVLTWMKFMTEPDNVKFVSEAAGSLFTIKFELGDNVDPLQQEFIRAGNEATFVLEPLSSIIPVDQLAEFGQILAAMALGEATPEEFMEMLVAAGN
jgi:raffinose/stachyose/melibiose transport system substrate-binding protein